MIRNVAIIGFAVCALALIGWLALAFGVYAMTDFDCGESCPPGVWQQFWIETLAPVVVWVVVGVLVYRKWIC